MRDSSHTSWCMRASCHILAVCVVPVIILAVYELPVIILAVCGLPVIILAVCVLPVILLPYACLLSYSCRIRPSCHNSFCMRSSVIILSVCVPPVIFLLYVCFLVLFLLGSSWSRTTFLPLNKHGAIFIQTIIVTLHLTDVSLSKNSL